MLSTTSKIIDLGNGQTKEIYYFDYSLNKKLEIKRISYYSNYSKERYHHEDGPAIIWFYRNGRVRSEHYYLNGKLHREDGPAVIFYNEDGVVTEKYYYLNNRELSKKSFENELIKLKLKII